MAMHYEILCITRWALNQEVCPTFYSTFFKFFFHPLCLWLSNHKAYLGESLLVGFAKNWSSKDWTQDWSLRQWMWPCSFLTWVWRLMVKGTDGIVYSRQTLSICVQISNASLGFIISTGRLSSSSLSSPLLSLSFWWRTLSMMSLSPHSVVQVNDGQARVKGHQGWPMTVKCLTWPLDHAQLLCHICHMLIVPSISLPQTLNSSSQ